MVTPKVTETFQIKVPDYYGNLPQPSFNSATKDGVALGRKLFFDPILSSNNKVSCATCHIPDVAFAEPSTIFSTKGVSQKMLHRHTPTLFNLAWHNGFFWDGGAVDLESQAFGPITHPDEQNKNLITLVQQLKTIPDYVMLFKKAFPKDTISSQKIAYALSQFQRSLISSSTLYDSFLKTKDSSIFSIQEKQGYKIFKIHCETCHKEPFLTDFEYHNNGLDADFSDDSFEGTFQGRYRVTLLEADKGKYKTPSLRNINLTAPYMHDGRFGHLDSVFNHYQNNIKNSQTLDIRLKNKIKLTDDDIKNIKAFFNTLTDSKIMIE